MTVGIANLLAIPLTGCAAVGAPPSLISPDAGWWRLLAPVMLACLIVAPLLTVVGLIAGVFGPKVSGGLCLAGLAASGIGVVIAAGLEGHPSGSLMFVGFSFLPAYIALDGMKTPSMRSPPLEHVDK